VQPTAQAVGTSAKRVTSPVYSPARDAPKMPRQMSLAPEVEGPQSPDSNVLRYSVSLVTQGRHRFYTLTMPSDVLAETCFVTNRFDDPDGGFQRKLDSGRAQEIADYIDAGFGTIPGSIILSAQPEAELKVVGKGKTVEFRRTKRAFLIIDGQHRVYGFSKASTALRVPVVIYNNLSRKEESKLFIDINTKQRSVPTELLLDIKKLAEYETETEALMGEVFDLFNSDRISPLLGLLSPAERVRGKLSRVTFYAGIKPLMAAFEGKEAVEIYQALGSYVQTFISLADSIHARNVIIKPAVFRAVMLLFSEVAQRVKDRRGQYTVEAFSEVLKPLFNRIRATALLNAPSSHNQLYTTLSQALRTSFTL
jgi:DGQHR domain-containing protein